MIMEIEKPNITCEEKSGGYNARFIVEPLEKGFGITLGNALRRTLLSSLPGAAAIAIRIPGVAHEFSTVPGVYEDVVDIILNIKNLAVRTTNTERDFETSLKIWWSYCEIFCSKRPSWNFKSRPSYLHNWK